MLLVLFGKIEGKVALKYPSGRTVVWINLMINSAQDDDPLLGHVGLDARFYQNSPVRSRDHYQTGIVQEGFSYSTDISDQPIVLVMARLAYSSKPGVTLKLSRYTRWHFCAKRIVR